MNLTESIRVALDGLAANKVRSGLTMLGVIIGVSAVIAMIAIGQGARQRTMNFIQSMGTNVLMVMSGQSRTGMIRAGMGSAQTLTYDDALAIKESCPAVVRVSAELRMQAQVKYRNMNTNTTIMGTTEDYPSIRNFQMAKGRFFTEKDVKSMRRVGVIGPTAAYNLFRQNSPINKIVRINGVNVKIIGMTIAKGTGGFGDPDDQIIIPLTTAQKRVFGIDYIRSISVQAKSMERMTEASTQIDELLRKRHKVGPASEPDFMIRSQAEVMETAEQMSRTFTMLLAGIATVSLLVGGIGIMNIMLVSVTERTREIGIRKAVGAKSKDILMQFLVESMVLSLVGGFAGIVLGIIGAKVLASISGWEAVVSIPAIVLAFSFAATVGIFFGIYPARKASSLRPIDALRYE
ncbi:MAG: ABC transporter permease [Armatimonadetes bacterium]|nr:ABC transporter permease [Armatimonadota bacterium]